MQSNLHSPPKNEIYTLKRLEQKTEFKETVSRDFPASVFSSDFF
jgi:hypothetical protein